MIKNTKRPDIPIYLFDRLYLRPVRVPHHEGFQVNSDRNLLSPKMLIFTLLSGSIPSAEMGKAHRCGSQTPVLLT